MVKKKRLTPEIETFLSDSYKRFRLSLRFQSPLQGLLPFLFLYSKPLKKVPTA